LESFHFSLPVSQSLEVAMSRFALALACWAGLAGVSFWGTPIWAEEPNWVGKKVIVKYSGVRVAFTEPDGNRRFIKNKNIVQEVRSEVDGWLEVGNDGDPGWLDKNDVVLLNEAPAYFAKRIQANPYDHYAYAYRGVALRHLGELDKSVQDLTEAIRLSPITAAWRNNRGLTYNSKKEYDRAIADYTDAMRLSPKWALPRNNRGLAYANKKNFDLAIADYSEALRLDPSYALALNNRGLAFYGKKDFDRAIADFSEALLLDEKNYRAYFNRGNAYRAKSEFERAVNDYNEAILLDGKYAAAYDRVANLQASCGKDSVRDGSKAIQNATSACKLTNWKNPGYLSTLAAAYAEDRQFGEAVKWQSKVLEASIRDKPAFEEARRRLELYRSGKPVRDLR
jgi:tetratricopeptide (TPR) repeat protein